jgi:hypothetical protein
MTGFTWEYLGLREEFVHEDAQKTPRSPNPPGTVHHGALVPHGTHRYLPPPEHDLKDHHDRYLTRACLAAPGDAYRQATLIRPGSPPRP